MSISKELKILKLTQRQQDELWGDGGPYSEMKMSIETRILDDSVSREFIVVEVNINPFTYKIVKKNREEFYDDPIVQQLIDTAEFRGKHYGYMACACRDELREGDMDQEEQVHIAVKNTKDAIIRMHRFILDKINKPAFTMRIK